MFKNDPNVTEAKWLFHGIINRYPVSSMTNIQIYTRMVSMQTTIQLYTGKSPTHTVTQKEAGFNQFVAQFHEPLPPTYTTAFTWNLSHRKTKGHI